ncbi:MAG TPA: carboxylesterase family protein [Alphaproteobacteria bacterium]|nr:carboxylesterase family protein [Alphaproteobacteria bacterium]
MASAFLNKTIRRFMTALAVSLAVADVAAAAPVATIDSGQLTGKIEGGADAFLGIPFARPPVGSLRWRPPQPPAAWIGARQATSYGPDCMQIPMSSAPGPGFANPTSEDCLYVNVWTPSRRPSKTMPVMVWIYGGAFIMGAGSYPDYDGAHFAEDGIVLVTFNYRVGLFGFFAHPALTREAGGAPVGNYGLMDQIAALKWVQRNIAAFGGDPKNVTIFGESAGGVFVNTLLESPAARGLFAKAISESGGGRTLAGGLGWPALSSGPGSAESRGAAWARSVGVTGDDVAALRAIPADVLVKASVSGKLPSPIIDGKLIPYTIDEAMAHGHRLSVPYMVGANSWEESLLQYLPNEAHDYVAAMTPATRKEALALYDDGGNADEDTAAKKLWGEAFMVAPARALARAMAASGAPTYLYHYAYVPVAMRGKVPGAAHSAEINLVFANEGRVSMFGEGIADKTIADLMHGYWVAFARTGDPNGDGRPKWPRYSATNDTLLDITNDGAAARKDFEETRLNLLDRIAAPKQP